MFSVSKTSDTQTLADVVKLCQQADAPCGLPQAVIYCLSSVSVKRLTRESWNSKGVEASLHNSYSIPSGHVNNNVCFA